MIEIKDLYASIEGKPILKGFSLIVRAGEIHAIMGPNGAGKSTLAKIIAGDPAYEVSSGEILFNGVNVLDLEPEERAHIGIFMGFQYPVEIAGLSNEQFLHAAHSAKQKAKGLSPLSPTGFSALLEEVLFSMGMKSTYKERNVNEGFSGGEKKRNEILQMALLKPELAILDETDSGLDIDAMKIVASGVNKLLNPTNALILITHYQRLLDYIKPHFIHVVIDGAIVLTGGPELALELEEKGYDWLLVNQ